MTPTLRPLLLLAALAGACAPANPPPGPPGGEPRAGEGGAAGEGEGGQSGEAGEAGGGGEAGGSSAGADLAVRASGALRGYCGSCHRGTHCTSTSGGFGAAFDVEAMVACGNLVPGSAEASPIWQRIRVGSMPPGGHMSRDAQFAVRDWIDAGAPPLPEEE